MTKVNVSTSQMNKFAGKWVAIDTVKNKIIAVGRSLKDIAPLVTRSKEDKTPFEKIPAAFKVPRKSESLYILASD